MSFLLPPSPADKGGRSDGHATAHSVLDQETGQLLEYRQLLKNPKFKENLEGLLKELEAE
jgi:hypothetical protein